MLTIDPLGAGGREAGATTGASLPGNLSPPSATQAYQGTAVIMTSQLSQWRLSCHNDVTDVTETSQMSQ